MFSASGERGIQTPASAVCRQINATEPGRVRLSISAPKAREFNTLHLQIRVLAEFASKLPLAFALKPPP
jgi:hypothetical protein